MAVDKTNKANFQSLINDTTGILNDFQRPGATKAASQQHVAKDSFEMASESTSLQSLEKGRRVAPSASVMPPSVARLLSKA